MRKPRVLIVEDEPIVALKFKRQIEGMAEVRVTFSGTDALVAEEEYKPDLILMDICLEDDPGRIDGIETVHRIQAKRDVPVIYITAHDDAEILRRVKTTDHYGYLLKPVAEKTLQTTIELVMDHFRKIQRYEERIDSLELLMESIAEPILVADAQGKITFCNAALARMLGKTEDDILGQPLNMALHVENELHQALDFYESVLGQGGVLRRHERARLLCTDGRMLSVQFSASPMYNARHELQGGVFLLSDNSRNEQERLLLENELIAMRQRLETIVPASEMLPICPNCKKVRDNDGIWYPVEHYLRQHLKSELTQGLCPDCQGVFLHSEDSTQPE